MHNGGGASFSLPTDGGQDWGCVVGLFLRQGGRFEIGMSMFNVFCDSLPK